VLGISALAALLTDIVFIMTALRANKVPNGYNLFILCSTIYGNVILRYSFTCLSDAYGMRLDDKDLLVGLLLIWQPLSLIAAIVQIHHPGAFILQVIFYCWIPIFVQSPSIFNILRDVVRWCCCWTYQYAPLPMFLHRMVDHSIECLSHSVGGLLITATNDMISVFYVATVGHMISASLIWFILPESLSPESRAANSSSHAAAKLANNETRMTPGLCEVAKRSLLSLFGFLIPLRTFLPRKRDIRGSGHGDDWNLTFIGLSSGVSFTILGMVALKFQYAEATFGWNSETVREIQ
jgi:hypothetical protein